MTAFIRAHPYVAAASAATVVGGGILGVLAFPDAWSFARRLAGGLFLGSGTVLILAASRFLGGDD